MTRHLCLTVTTDCDNVRTDLKSDDVQRVFPELSLGSDWGAHRESVNRRVSLLRRCDESAYNRIRHAYPDFKPPHMRNGTDADALL